MSVIRAIQFLDSLTDAPFGVENINGRQGVSCINFPREISLGHIAGAGKFQSLGANPALSVGSYETLWNVGGLYSYLSTPQTLKVSSTSANDTAAGTGARRIQLIGLVGTGWLYYITDVILNGITPVAVDTPEEDGFIRVWQAFVLDTGSGGANAGDISIRDNTDTITLCQIQTGYGYSSQAVWTVPGDSTGYIENQSVAVASGKVATGRVLIRLNILSLFGFNPMLLTTSEFSVDSTTGQRFFVPPLDLPPRTDYEVQAKGGVAGVSANASADFWYI